jgi:hypothetical protein
MYSVALVAALIAAISSSAELQTLREQVRKQGNVDVVELLEYAPTTLPELATRAESIIEGRIGACLSSRLTADERSVHTDCTVQVVRVFKGAAVQTMTLRRPGGVISLEGRTVHVASNGSPDLNANETYIVFLQYDSASRTYSILFGPQGTLRVENDTVVQEPDSGPDEQVAAMSIDELRKAVLDLIAQRRQQ